MNWATLYDNCSFEAKKMIAAQFIKAVRVKRSYELEIEFNVSFSEFQRLYLEPERKGNISGGQRRSWHLRKKQDRRCNARLPSTGKPYFDITVLCKYIPCKQLTIKSP